MDKELSLTLLGKEYDALLTQYEQAYKNYVDFKSSTASSESHATLKGRTFWGTGGVTERASNNVEDCKGLCSSISTCTGATFNPDKKYCWVRKGEGDVIPGLDNDYAIVPKNKQFTNILYTINSQLIALNTKIMEATAASVPNLTQQGKTRGEVNDVLLLNYQNLMDEKRRIDLLIREYESAEDIHKNTSLLVNQKYSIYISFTLFLIILVVAFILFNM